MKDWSTLEPDIIKLIQSNRFTKGRGGRKVRYIVLHHVAGISTTEQVWQTWQTREASAHYLVEPSGRVGQLVYDADTAWANADPVANAESITIEHSNCGGPAQDWPISDATIEEGAHLVAALCHHFKLGRPEWGKNVRGHSDFYSTECPYHLRKGHKYHNHYMGRAQYWYDLMVSGKTPATSPTSAKEAPVAAGITLGGVSAAALHEGKVAAQSADRKLDLVLEQLAGLQDQLDEQGVLVNLVMDQLVGPGRDASGLPTFNGWTQVGTTIDGRGLSLVDGIAAARLDLTRIEKFIKESK